MKRLFLLLILWSCSFMVFAQVNYTANDQVTPYAGLFRPGINFDYYPPYTGVDLANISAGNPALNLKGIGSKTSRPALYDKFTEDWGIDFLVSDFQHFESLGMSEMTMIIGFPAEWHRDHQVYCSDGVTQSQMFANLYTPIWDGGANGTPYNDDNYLAAYMYQLVTTYKDHIKFWEIWNEPGFDHSYVQGWQPPGGPGNWWDNDPDPCVNHFKAPIEHFVRTLRISYDVIKTVDPDAYVALAGVGFESFLDAVLRNTDNPIDGSVTAEYPLGGGAYFDVMGFHTYPDIDGSVREFVNGQWVYHRNSDAAAQGVPKRKNTYQNRLAQYGYDGVTYPKKEWIITEINTPRVPFYDTNPNSMASDESQTNYITKATVAAMKIDIRQMHPYQLADRKTVANAIGEFDLLGMYLNFTDTQPYTNLTKTNEGIAYTTTSKLIFGTRYDAAKTAAMNLPNNLDGGAFYDAANNRYKYILWAKTTLDLSEAASGTYSFPSSFGLTTINKREWNWSETNSSSDISPNNIALTGRPIYLIDGQDPGNGNLTITCPDDILVEAPQGGGNVVVTWIDAIGITTCPGSTASVTQTAGMASGSSFWMGTHPITYGAFDQCGNTATCSFNVIVGPNTGGSTINTSCPGNISITAAAGANSAVVTWATPTATTTCATNSTVTVSQTSGLASGNNFAIGTHTIVYTFTDQCGTTSTCNFTVTVSAPTTSQVQFTWCSPTVTVNADAGATSAVVVWNAPLAGTDCPTSNAVTITQTQGQTNGSSFAIGTHTISYQATDQCGNTTATPCTFSVVVNETTTSTCDDIAGFTKVGELNGHGYYVSTANWNWQDGSSFAAQNGGYLVSINNMGENIFVQGLLSEMAYIGLYDLNTEGSPEWDNGDAVTYTNYSTSCPWCNDNGPNYDFAVMLPWDGSWVFENQWVSRPIIMEVDCGGAASGDLTVNSCQSDITQTLATGSTEVAISWPTPTASTTCSTSNNVTVTQSSGQNSGSSFSAGTYSIVYDITDQCGNTATCSFTVTVNTETPNGSCDAIVGFTKLGEYDGKGYYISNDEMTWNDASAMASANGGGIAAISSQAENDFLANLINDLVYIGFNDASTEGAVVWESGEALGFTNYSDCDWCGLNTAENDFGIMLPWNGKWSFNNQWVHRKFIMETSCDGGGGTDCPTTIAGFTNLGDFNGHNYYLADDPLNWSTAEAVATSIGGYLATMNDQAENDFLKDNLGNNMVFIGYNDVMTEGTGQWANGEAVTLDLSFNNDDENDFGVMNFWAGTWQMVNHWVVKKYVVEMNCSGSIPQPVPQFVQTNLGIKMVSMYPNPADDMITARILSENDEEVTFTIFNTQGQAKVLTTSHHLVKGPNEIDFDIQDIESGMYFLKITGKNINQVIRFTKVD